MEHLLVRVGRRAYLLCEPQVTAERKTTGYGNLLRNIRQGVRVASSLGAALYLVPSSVPPLNRAVFDVDSPDADVVGQTTARAALWRTIWRASAPFRYGAPIGWLGARLAPAARPLLHRLMLVARRRGWRAVDRALNRWEQTIRSAPASYARLSTDRWRRLTTSARERDRAQGAAHRRPRLALRARDRAAVLALAREAGIDPAKPIVTLHVRESGYRQRGADRQRHVDAVRDAAIATYADAAAWLVDQGYQVIRLGDRSMTPCRWPGVVDAATAAWRTDEFELWAMLNSRFFVASDSGPYFLAVLCEVPSIVVNVVQIGYYTARSGDRYICKQVRNRATGALLQVSAMLTPEFIGTALDPDRWEWVDNTPRELLEAVQDMHRLQVGPNPPRTAGQVHHDRLLDDLAGASRFDRSQTSALLFRRRGPGTVSAHFSDKFLDSSRSPLP